MPRFRNILPLVILAATAAGAVDLSNCVMCHKPGGAAPAPPGGLAASAHGALACWECHTNARAMHATTGVTTLGCGACHDAERDALAASAHAPGKFVTTPEPPVCATCHGGGHRVSSPARTNTFQPTYAPEVCGSCHDAERSHYLKSAHGLAAGAAEPTAPTCSYCHGDAHHVKPLKGSPELAPARELAFCGRCHAGKALAKGPPYVMADPQTQLLAGVHGRVNAATGLLNATCADCHGAHDEQPAWSPASPVNYRNVAATCGKCHAGEYAAYRISVHALGAAAGAKESPTCESCHGGHNIVTVMTPGEDRGAQDIALCSGCHTSPPLAAKFGMATAPALNFGRTYHGVVRSGGKTSAADCGDCHHVHDVLPSADPRAATNPARRKTTCGKCHPDAGPRFLTTDVHAPLTGFYGAPGRVVAYIYVPLIALILGGMLLHNATDWFKKVRTVRREELAAGGALSRLTAAERLQHIVLLLSFTTLAFTGFTIKWPAAWFAAWLVKLEGVVPLRSTIHKSAAVVLLAVTAVHLVYLLGTKPGRARLRALLPRPRDAADGAGVVLHNVGLRKEAPAFGEFNYAEKAEYWALAWGTAVMALTGLYIWLDPVWHRLFPFWLYEVVRTVHFYEAVLAAASIAVWHLYAVIFDPAVYPMNWAWLDGKVPRLRWGRERGKYLAGLERSKAEVGSPDAESEPLPGSPGTGDAEG